MPSVSSPPVREESSPGKKNCFVWKSRRCSLPAAAIPLPKEPGVRTRLRLGLCLALSIVCCGWATAQAQPAVSSSREPSAPQGAAAVTLGQAVIPLYGPWKFKIGDSPLDPVTHTPLRRRGRFHPHQPGGANRWLIDSSSQPETDQAFAMACAGEFVLAPPRAPSIPCISAGSPIAGAGGPRLGGPN